MRRKAMWLVPKVWYHAEHDIQRGRFVGRRIATDLSTIGSLVSSEKEPETRRTCTYEIIYTIKFEVDNTNLAKVKVQPTSHCAEQIHWHEGTLARAQEETGSVQEDLGVRKFERFVGDSRPDIISWTTKLIAG